MVKLTVYLRLGISDSDGLPDFESVFLFNFLKTKVFEKRPSTLSERDSKTLHCGLFLL